MQRTGDGSSPMLGWLGVGTVFAAGATFVSGGLGDAPRTLTILVPCAAAVASVFLAGSMIANRGNMDARRPERRRRRRRRWPLALSAILCGLLVLAAAGFAFLLTATEASSDIDYGWQLNVALVAALFGATTSFAAAVAAFSSRRIALIMVLAGTSVGLAASFAIYWIALSA